MRQLLEDSAERAIAYLENIDQRTVAPGAAALEKLQKLAGQLPVDGQDAASILTEIDAIGGPATIANAGGRYFGFVTGGALPATVAANWLATAWDQNGFSTVSSPLAAALEEAALGWLLDIFGFPANAGGAFVTGATMANFSGLAAARHVVLAAHDWNVEADGLFGAPPITVIVGGEVHASLLKALKMLGLGQNRITSVPVDKNGRMIATEMPMISGPTIVCLQAGNVNSGAFDPAAEIIPAAQAAGAWVHTDGAFGIWAKAAPARAALARGFELTDSLAVDGHKWLNVPYDNGFVLLRDPSALHAVMSVSAAYLPQAGARDPYDFTPECSRRMRGLDVWIALKHLGRSGLADLIESCCHHAGRFADGLAQAGFEILNDVDLNQVVVSFGDDRENERVIAGIQADGTCWCGGTVWQGRAAMRISVSSWATTAADVDKSLAAIIRVAQGRNSTD